MGISLSCLTHDVDNPLHPCDCMTPTWVQFTFTFNTQVGKKIGFINMRGNSSKDTEWQLQITLFSPRLFLQDTLHLGRYCLSRPPCKLEDQNTHVQCVWVCLCVGFRDDSLDPISCLLPIPISIFALWKLTLVPKCGVCKWLCELAAPFSATAQMHHKRTIWSRRPEQRLSTSTFPLPLRT